MRHVGGRKERKAAEEIKGGRPFGQRVREKPQECETENSIVFKNCLNESK